jgi:hypothetical protein
VHNRGPIHGQLTTASTPMAAQYGMEIMSDDKKITIINNFSDVLTLPSIAFIIWVCAHYGVC